MNTITPTHRAFSQEVDEARFALRVCAHLNEGASSLPQDVLARLALARQQALIRAAQVRAMGSTPHTQRRRAAGHVFKRSFWRPEWITALASAVPVVVVLAGLALIQHQHLRSQVAAVADIDSALLADHVPPDAYSDDGFLEFLKSPPL